MDPRSIYLTQMLEKIGAPLLSAITIAHAGKEGNDAAADATAMASLLAKTVQLSIDLANASELSKSDVQNDSLRVALAALAAPMVAEIYKKDAVAPSDQDLKKTTSALQAVMSFSENFAPDPENIQRLQNLRGEEVVIDAHQMNVQYIHAFIPVVNAVAGFSFGQQEQKLIMDIASKLVAKAANMSRSLFKGLNDEQKKFGELASLRSLAELYASVHESETKRLETMSEEERTAQPQALGGGLALDHVWSAFDLRLAMLEAIAQNALPGGESAGEAAPATPPSTPAQEPQKIEPIKVEPPPSPPAETKPAGEAAAGNPMSMFAKPKDDEPPATEASPPPAEPETPPTPPAEEPPAAPPETPSEAPPAPPESPAKTPLEKPAEDKPAEGGDPMSFFKSPPKKDGED